MAPQVLYPVPILGDSSAILPGARTKISMTHSHTPHLICLQILLDSKYVQNSTISIHPHCCSGQDYYTSFLTALSAFAFAPSVCS